MVAVVGYVTPRVYLGVRSNPSFRKELIFPDFEISKNTSCSLSSEKLQFSKSDRPTQKDLAVLRDLNLLDDLQANPASEGKNRWFFSYRVKTDAPTVKQPDVKVYSLAEDGVQEGLTPERREALKKAGFLVLRIATVACVAYFIAPGVSLLCNLFTDFFQHVFSSVSSSFAPASIPSDMVTTPLMSDPLSVSTMVPVDPLSGVAASSATIPGSAAAVPVMAQAPAVIGSSPGWQMVIRQVLSLVDVLIKGIIIFAGVSWMFGNRTRALETLLSGGIGYIIVRHHDDIARFFASL